MRAIAYYRISQDRTGLQAGVTRQQKDARALAQRRDWTLVAEHIDNDTSAAKGRRPGFEAMLEQLADADVLIAWALDRLTRNRRDTVRLIEAAQQHGVLIALVRGSDMDMSTPAGRLTADILASVARSEIEQKADRQQRASEQAAAEGRWHGGVRPFGYEADGVTIREAEAVIVRQVYAWLLEGIGFREIARRLNAAGSTTSRGSTWTGGGVRQSLIRPRYAGLRTHRGEVVGPAAWPAIVDDLTYHAAQSMLADPARRHRQPDRRLLSRIATCGQCGAPLDASSLPRGPGYRCSASYGHVGRLAAPIDELVTAIVVDRLQRPDALALFAPDEPDITPLVRQADDLRERTAQLAEAYADGMITLPQLRRGTERARAQLAEVEARIASSRPVWGRARDLVAGDVAARWEEMSLQDRRAIIEHVCDVTVMPVGKGRRHDPESVRIRLR